MFCHERRGTSLRELSSLRTGTECDTFEIIMQLTVNGLDDAPVRFRHLWGCYVHGFRPWMHCIACFACTNAKGILPTMRDGEYELDDKLFYLCGVGQKVSENLHPHWARRFTNVHLAVRPRLGSVAAIGSVYGVIFTIRGAQAIPIEPLSASEFPALSEAHYRCKNFQFGYQMFNVDAAHILGSMEVATQFRKRWPHALSQDLR
jgi:hypothetical protein